RFFDRYFAIDSMQLINIDSFELQSLQTLVHALRQIFWSTIRYPIARPRSGETALGRNHQIFWIWMQRFRNQQLARLGAVGVGRINQIPTELDHAPQNLLRVLAIRWPPPNSRAGDP